MKIKTFCAVAALLMSHIGSAQQPPQGSTGVATAEYITPWVHADRTIEFHLAAPKASEVQLKFANKPVAMSKEASGWWSATVGPVDPDIYTYNYIVDGASVYAVIDGAGLDNSQVEVPGTPPRYDELQNVPHGVIALHEYYSKIQGRTRHFRVYLPPQYYSEPKRRFPVLYLFNGFDDIQWTTLGKINVVQDNLIAHKQAVPMIVVMPFNRIHGETVAQVAAAEADAKTPEERAGLASSLDTIAVFQKELPGEIMPIVESDYRVIADRNHRAIAGLSFGGGTAFGLAARRLDLFGYLGEFATGTFGGTHNPPGGYVGYGPFVPDNFTPHLYEKLSNPATRLKLFYMACGEEDPRLPFQKDAYEEFKRRGVSPLVFETLPGGHEYKFFRRAMANFSTQIFK